MANNVRIVKVEIERKIPLFEHVCPVCSEKFMGAKLAVYDKPECRKKAAWQRNGEKYNAARRKGGETK